MSENRQIQNSTTTRRNNRVVTSVQTTDATPLVAYSIPLGESRANLIRAEVIAIRSDYGALQDMICQAGFRRPAGGDVTRATSASGSGLPYLSSSGDFTGVSPTVDLIANTGTQTIDVRVRGKAATTINWHISTLSMQNLL